MGYLGRNFIMDWVNITLFLSMTLVVLILAWGLITMARGGDYNKSHSNILMRYRIIFQAIAMVKLNKIYTRTGDDGSTGLTDGSRVQKHSPRPQAYGSVDELNSSLGMVYFSLNKENSNLLHIEIKNLIREIQNDLFDLGADLATPISEEKEKYPALRI